MPGVLERRRRSGKSPEYPNVSWTSSSPAQERDHLCRQGSRLIDQCSKRITVVPRPTSKSSELASDGHPRDPTSKMGPGLGDLTDDVDRARDALPRRRAPGVGPRTGRPGRARLHQRRVRRRDPARRRHRGPRGRESRSGQRSLAPTSRPRSFARCKAFASPRHERITHRDSGNRLGRSPRRWRSPPPTCTTRLVSTRVNDGTSKFERTWALALHLDDAPRRRGATPRRGATARRGRGDFGHRGETHSSDHSPARPSSRSPLTKPWPSSRSRPRVELSTS